MSSNHSNVSFVKSINQVTPADTKGAIKTPAPGISATNAPMPNPKANVPNVYAVSTPKPIHFCFVVKLSFVKLDQADNPTLIANKL